MAVVGAAGLAVGTASAGYIGPGYLKVAGVRGDAKPATYRGWAATRAHYWIPDKLRNPIANEVLLTFSGPVAPVKGPSALAVSIEKTSAGVPRMIDLCKTGTVIPEMTFAESSHLVRSTFEHGPAPKGVPDHYEYTLKNVRLKCPVAADAPEQAFVFEFEDIAWTNYAPDSYSGPIDVQPAKLGPAAATGSTKTAVVTWMSNAVDANVNQCARMNAKPAQADYYRYLSPERAEAQRKALASLGGVPANVMLMRAPGELNATRLPGTLADSNHALPAAEIVPGLNLDKDDGSGAPPRGIRKHKNYVAPWGEKGIDNQMFLVEGCVEGWRRNGFLPLVGNDMRASGELSILVHVSGIDDETSDDDVTVDFLYSRDGMKRVGPQKVLLPDYTYRLSTNINDTYDFVRFKGRIVDGVITTQPLDKMYVHFSNGTAQALYSPRFRLQFDSSGAMKGYLGGYRDWREYIAYAFINPGYENTISYNSAGMYQAIRRAADGLYNQETGEFDGISSAIELEGIAAFIPPEQRVALLKQQ